VGGASGGRLTLWLLGLAVLIASGATGIVVRHDNSAPPHSSGSGSAQMRGSSDQRPDRDQPVRATAAAAGQPQSPGSRSPAAQAQARAAAAEAAAARRSGRYNVGATHSPELLQSLSGSSGSLTSAEAGPGNAPRGVDVATPRGVDVAADQHPGGAGIGWAQVAAAGYSFAAVKATEGDYYANPYYAADVAGAQAAGLQVTGYHVAIPNVSGGAAQADYAVGHLGDLGGTAGATPALELDVEYDPYTATDHTNQCYGLTAPQLVTWIGAFTRQAQQLTGQAPMIYTTAGWWRACTGDSTAFSADALWVAGDQAGQPALPAAWASYSYCQFTSTATVPGIAARGSVDVSYRSPHTTPYAPAVAGLAGGAAGAMKPAASSQPAVAAAPPVAVSAGAAASAAASSPGGPVAEVAPRPEAPAPSPVASEVSPSPGASS
jgi:GH25 family lysozyme M1 (1,4-beta-N-acetylmuramidase)